MLPEFQGGREGSKQKHWKKKREGDGKRSLSGIFREKDSTLGQVEGVLGREGDSRVRCTKGAV